MYKKFLMKQAYFIENLLPVAIGAFGLFSKEKIIDYYDSFSKEYYRPLNRKI